MEGSNRWTDIAGDALCRPLLGALALIVAVGAAATAGEPLVIRGGQATSQLVIRANQSQPPQAAPAPSPAPQTFAPPALENLPAPADQLQRDDRAWLTEDQRPIGSVTLNITNPAGAMPTTFGRAPEPGPPLDGRADFVGPTGGIRPVRADLCHNPLYFEERRVERTGQALPCGQTVVSGLHFFGNAALLPAKMVVHPPRSIVCQDRYFRRNEYLQEHPAAAGATGFLQSSFWTGMFLLP